MAKEDDPFFFVSPSFQGLCQTACRDILVFSGLNLPLGFMFGPTNLLSHCFFRGFSDPKKTFKHQDGSRIVPVSQAPTHGFRGEFTHFVLGQSLRCPHLAQVGRPWCEVERPSKRFNACLCHIFMSFMNYYTYIFVHVVMLVVIIIYQSVISVTRYHYHSCVVLSALTMVWLSISWLWRHEYTYHHYDMMILMVII